jgi:GST-like protein
MTMHTLYGAPGSGSAIAEFALERCGLRWRSIRAAAWEPDSALDELRRVNPLGQIPTLVLPDGTVLTESVAILVHLGLAHPHSGLLAQEAAPRAQQLRGMVFIAANCYSAIGICDAPEHWTASRYRPSIDKVGQAARAQLHRHWALFADSFEARPYYGGAAPAGLDILAAVVSKWSGTRQYLAKRRPVFLQTLQRIEAHPSVAPVFARHWPA